MITSATNDRIKEVKKLVKSASYRRDKGLYVVEGIRMFRELPVKDIDSVFVSQGAYEKLKEDILKLVSEDEVIIVADHVFSSMSDTNTPQGVMALVKMRYTKLRDVISDNAFVLIAERLQDPGNLGTIIRTAEGAGATGIILSSDCVDMYNPKVIRSTMGSVFRVPIYISENLEEDIDQLKSQGVCIFGAHLDGKEFYDENFEGSCGFLIGNEGNGLSHAVSSKADKLIRIPMCGKVESLNAATSVAVISYEVLRQRRNM
ncbi:MAG: RNA methyltransferase [Lachnospiraceae bacterium]|nr:RNA methyltransferase [Lachnospiraceae bacterium]